MLKRGRVSEVGLLATDMDKIDGLLDAFDEKTSSLNTRLEQLLAVSSDAQAKADSSESTTQQTEVKATQECPSADKTESSEGRNDNSAFADVDMGSVLSSLKEASGAESSQVDLVSLCSQMEHLNSHINSVAARMESMEQMLAQAAAQSQNTNQS